MNIIAEELEKLELNNQLRRIPDIDFKSDGIIVIKGRNYKNFASNDYLGISTKLKLRDEFLKNNNSLMSSASARLLTLLLLLGVVYVRLLEIAFCSTALRTHLVIDFLLADRVVQFTALLSF